MTTLTAIIELAKQNREEAISGQTTATQNTWKQAVDPDAFNASLDTVLGMVRSGAVPTNRTGRKITCEPGEGMG